MFHAEDVYPELNAKTPADVHRFKLPRDVNDPDVATLKARQDIKFLAQPQQPERQKFSVSRWPYTYAYDHVRGRVPGNLSRAETSQYVKRLAAQAGLPRDFVCEILANAHCLENNIQLPARGLTA